MPRKELIVFKNCYTVSDVVRDRDYADRVWKFTLEGSSCSNMSLCDFVIPTDEEETTTESEIVRIQLQWDDTKGWQSEDGPTWTDGNGSYPQGVPTIGASVVIPESKQII